MPTGESGFHALACPVHPGFGRPGRELKNGCSGGDGEFLENHQAHQVQIRGAQSTEGLGEILIERVPVAEKEVVARGIGRFGSSGKGVQRAGGSAAPPARCSVPCSLS